MKRRKSILLVEDDVDTLETFAMVLGEVEFDAFCAMNGPQAIQLAKERLPDAILLDVGLPRFDGFEIARALRRIDGLSKCLIIGISGYANPQYFEDAKAAGMDAYFAKPIQTEELLACMRTYFDDGRSYYAKPEDWSIEVQLKGEECNRRLRLLSARSSEACQRAAEISSHYRNLPSDYFSCRKNR